MLPRGIHMKKSMRLCGLLFHRLGGSYADWVFSTEPKAFARLKDGPVTFFATNEARVLLRALYNPRERTPSRFLCTVISEAGGIEAQREAPTRALAVKMTLLDAWVRFTVVRKRFDALGMLIRNVSPAAAAQARRGARKVRDQQEKQLQQMRELYEKRGLGSPPPPRPLRLGVATDRAERAERPAHKKKTAGNTRLGLQAAKRKKAPKK